MKPIRLILLLFFVFVINSASAQWQGSGTSIDPYKIYTLDDMKALANKVNINENTLYGTHFKLMNDIDFNFDTTYIPIGGRKWTDAKAYWGALNIRFQGEFDGNYKVIRNLRIIKKNYHTYAEINNNEHRPSFNLGVFGLIGEYGVVKNLGIERGYIQGCSKIGLLCGLNFGSIEGCYANGIIIGGYEPPAQYPPNQPPIVYSPDGDYIGGLIGDNEGNAYNSYTDVMIELGILAVSGFANAVYIGGPSIKNCYSKSVLIEPTFGQSHCFCYASADSTIGLPPYYKYNYYIEDCALNGVNPAPNNASRPKNTNEFLSAMIIDSLNMELEIPMFVRSLDSTINDGYPLLWWQVRDYVHTEAVSNLDYTSATLHGSFSRLIPDVTESGFYYREEGEQQWLQSVATFDTIGDTNFSANIIWLNLDSRIEYMAYVKGNGGSIYRSYQRAFSVLNSQGSAITLPPVVDTQSVILKGYYVDGYLPTTQKGFEWKKTTDTSYVSIYITDDISDTMTYHLSGLSSNTDYTYRAFIVNNATRYGEWEDFRTLGNIGLDKISNINNAITLYPNPTKNKIIINSSNRIINKVEVYNLLGQKIYEKELNDKTININASKFGKGNYITKIYSKDGGVINKKLVVE